jgi:cytochrome P450
VISDPDLARELLTNNRFDKSQKINRLLFRFAGKEALVLQPADHIWSKKRKLLSAVFYKNKISVILMKNQHCITNYMKNNWEDKSGVVEIDLGVEVLKIISACATNTTIGMSDKTQELLKFENYDGTFQDLSLGVFMKRTASMFNDRMKKYWLYLTDLFDDIYIGS